MDIDLFLALFSKETALCLFCSAPSLKSGELTQK